MILEHRQHSKLLSSFILPLVTHAVPFKKNKHKIFADWNNCSTGTGRLSSSNPNLQTLPTSRHTLSDIVEIRKAFCVEKENNILISADYSQVEMRVLALLSGDENLQRLFRCDDDVYKLMASMALYDGDCTKVSKEDRNRAKTICLALIYGMGSLSLAHSLDQASRDEADDLKRNFLKKFPRILKFINDTKAGAKQTGYVRIPISKRRRHLPEINSKEYRKRSHAERQAVNTLIQGMASDMLKTAMIRIRNAIEKLHQHLRRDIVCLRFQIHGSRH